MYLNSDNALLLAKKLEEIPNVVQVRFNYVLRDTLIQDLGANAINYNCFVKSVDQTNAAAQGSTIYERFMMFIPERIYENVDAHEHVQSVMNERIGHYYRTNGEKIEVVGQYSFPYKVDADGNKIPYRMVDSNPVIT